LSKRSTSASATKSSPRCWLARSSYIAPTSPRKDESEVPPKLAALHANLIELADEFQFKVAKPVEDEEHHTWSICFTDSQGATRCIDWILASRPEFRQMMSKYTLIKEFLEPPFLVEYAPKAAKAAGSGNVESDEATA
jgi:DNA gyrase subunit B